ncbi:hypothetical protein VaNZ11_002176, partial [Volvox africanus]
WPLVASKELPGLLVLTLLFLLVVAGQATRVVRDAIVKEFSIKQVLDRFSNLLVDMVVAGLLVAASATCAWYMLSQASSFAAKQTYDVYDGLFTARARWLLPRRVDMRDILAKPSQAAELKSSLLAINITDENPKAGSP